jgi:hypothetical protein
MRIQKLIGTLEKVKDNLGDIEISIRIIDDEGIHIHPIAGISSNAFEGINITNSDD